MTELALLPTNIEGEVARAHRLYDEGYIGIRRRDAWLRRLEHQMAVRVTIDHSLANADQVIMDEPIGRDVAEETPVRTRKIRKFAVGL